MLKYIFKFHRTIFMVALLFASISTALALDTDIYQANVKQNAYILLDNSGSMDFGVYESNVDYGALYDYLFIKPAIGDTIASGNWFNNHNTKTKIFLVKGKNYDTSGNSIGVSIINIDGEDEVFTGDAADPEFLWYSGYMIDTHTYIDAAGNLSGEEGETQRVTANGEGHVLLDALRLPLGQDILLKDFTTLYDGSMINEGFGGMLNAPGYYFSGLEDVGVGAGGHDQVENGDTEIYFFITGNWMNMQQVYNLHYTSNPPGAVAKGDPAWKYEEFPVEAEDWSVTEYELDYPEGSGDYANNLSEADTMQTITHSGATKIQIHFSMFDVEADNNSNTFSWDYVAIYDASGDLVEKYDGDNSPQGDWSPVIAGSTVTVKLYSDQYVEGKGYTIDKYRTTYGDGGGSSGTYLMQNRLDVAKDAMLYVLDEFRGKINWGFASFKYNGSTANGATFGPFLNPTVNDDTNRQAIVTQLNNTDPKYGTPLGEALQDVFEDGYYGKRNSLDNLLCRKNYAIVVSDGFPSGDNDWSRIGGVTFSDFDGDGFTADPYQYNNPPDNYYDDVAHWIYTHSWIDKSEITDPANSYENVIPHQIAFGAKHPLMRDAAEESGAEYITAYNKTQLVNAFHSLGMMISQAVSFTAPVVSVDAANKIQNGDDLFMGLFLPMDSDYWPGNIKHFQFGDGSTERPKKWQIYDAGNNEATDSNGTFLDNLDGYWGDDIDANDSDNNGGADIKEDGVGEVLAERVQGDFIDGTYYERTIKTWLNDTLTDFTQANVTTASLGLGDSDTELRNKIVNLIYGYSFDADATTGEPVAPREWALGAIIHSSPTIIDYYDSSDYSAIDKRYIAVGANDGMLHVFDNDDGAEIFAFVPDDVLPKLPAFADTFHQPLVDGIINIIRQDGQPKYLVFGLRRGGSSYWRIDISDSTPANWTIAKFNDGEMGQSWSDIKLAKIRTGENDFTTVAIFSGGYDPYEDNFPEPFDDLDYSGTPYKDNGSIDNQEWSSGDNDQDVKNNNQYDVYNPDGNSHGRAIYVVDIKTMNLLFSVKHGATDSPTRGTFNSSVSQTRSDFLYCFPATPTVVEFNQKINDTIGRKNNILAAIYAPDIYGNMFRVVYDYADGDKLWQVKHIFSANPGSSSGSGEIWDGSDNNDLGRKVFYGPEISWGGSGRYFDKSNYRYPDTEFDGTDEIASLYFGTGDREHPTYQIARNRIYAIYDDSEVLATATAGSVDVSSIPYTENDLLNITCDELGIHTTQSSGDTYTYKTELQTLLFDDVINPDDTAPMELNSGNGENDAKGWYIILDKQGESTYCSHCNYEATVDTSEGGRDNHVGEKILCRFALFNSVLYFTSYQPSYDDPCAPQGNAFNYALNNLNGAAALNLNSDNDANSGDDPLKKDVTDRYDKHEGVKGIPSGFEIVIRDDEVAAIASIGDGIKGGGDDPDNPFKIDELKKNINPYFWIER
ncbi:MAG: PilC/PilY family type IV pilus protein [Thermodesulfobacteriota bacterium]|nr:PilC/PilY family type IV pilus protein [Thermodesulfobacteriota bacterium]